MIQVNSILYTKDGRKSGNLTCIHIKKLLSNLPIPEEERILVYEYWFMSDYGDLIKVFNFRFEMYRAKQFYSKLGIANESHKYYNYIESHPELLI